MGFWSGKSQGKVRKFAFANLVATLKLPKIPISFKIQRGQDFYWSWKVGTWTFFEGDKDFFGNLKNDFLTFLKGGLIQSWHHSFSRGNKCRNFWSYECAYFVIHQKSTLIWKLLIFRILFSRIVQNQIFCKEWFSYFFNLQR